MDKELRKNLRLLDFMGVEFLCCRNIDRLVTTDIVYFKLKKFEEFGAEQLAKIFGE
jgi:hypothetical protein